MEEYENAKHSIVEGKSCGEDGIPPEMVKRCGLDEEIALLKGQKPEVYGIKTTF